MGLGKLDLTDTEIGDSTSPSRTTGHLISETIHNDQGKRLC